MTEPPKDAERPTAFVSYAQSGDSWQKTVLQFTTALRRVGGVEAELDLFHSADHRQWTTFGPSLIDKSDFTLIAVDSAYKRRWEGAETEGVGAGAAREAAAIKAIFERSQDEALRRVKVILLPGSKEADIPSDLLGFSERFVISAFDADGLELLLRSLWGKPAFPKPALGPIPVLPPRAIAELQDQDSEATPLVPDQEKDASKIDEHDRDTLTKRLEELVKEPRDSAPQARQPGDVTDEIEREIAILKASLGALTEAQNAAKSTGHEEVSTPDALGPFIAALDDRDESVRFEAMAALGDRLDLRLLPRIEALLDDRDPYIRRYAVEYYARLADPEAPERLVKALDDSDESVRFEAMAALGDRLEPSLLPRIKALLDDRDPYIRRYAVEYYAQLSKKER